MKKLNLLFAVLAIASLAFTSCSKDDPEPTFAVADAYGVWEQTAGDNFVACPDGDNKLIEIDETTITEGMTDEDGCDNGGYATFDYTYVNGNTFDVELGKYKITSLEDGVMTLSMSSIFAEGSTTITLEKIEE